jgi:uncharacterized protein YbjT (DUF2867 family)
MEYPKISSDPQIQADYEEIRRRGEEHNLAVMLARRSPPAAQTDREFLHGHCNGNQFAGMEYLGDHYASEARRQGVNITGKVYLSGLAAYPGDPKAWVAGKGDVERVLDERGWGAEGAIKRNVSNVAEPLNVGVDPALVQEKVDSILAGVEDPQYVDREDLSEQVENHMKPHWVK